MSHPDHECRGRITGHHVVPVGRGGKDHANVIPVCWHLHSLIHGQVWGWSAVVVAETFGVSLPELAVEITDTLLADGAHPDMFDLSH